MANLSWSVSMKDRVSAVADKVGGRLSALNQRFANLDKASNLGKAWGGVEKLAAFRKASSQERVVSVAEMMGKVFGTKGSNFALSAGQAWFSNIKPKIETLKTAFGGLGGVVGTVGSKMGSALKSVASAIGSVIQMAAQAALVLGAMGAGLAVAGVKYIADIQAFKSSTMFAFNALLGSQSLAEDAWNKAKATALMTGMGLQETASAYNQLLSQGMGLGEVDTLVKRLADLKAMNPKANLEGIALAIRQIKSTGKLQGDELLQLAEAGLSTEEVYKQLEKQLGKNREQVLDLQKAGKITDKQALQAINDALAKQTGRPAGALAQEAAGKTLLGALGRAKAMIESFASSIKIDFSPIGRFVERVGKVLEGDSGKRFGASIENALNSAIKILDGISEKDIATGFDTAAGLIDDAANAARDLSSAISTIDGWLASINSKTSTWGAIFSAMGGVISWIGDSIVSTLLGPLYTVYDVATDILETLGLIDGKKESVVKSVGKDGNKTASGAHVLGGGDQEASKSFFDGVIRNRTVKEGGAGAAGAGAGEAASKTINQTVTVNATGITMDELTARIAAEVKRAMDASAAAEADS